MKPKPNHGIPHMVTSKKIRYVAEPKHVREVTLSGATDFGFWSDYLKAEGLTPVRCGDAAQLLIVATEMTYLGIRFTEVSFSVRTVLTPGGSSDGARLLQAFTSNRFFAWCERKMFATPYSYGSCQVSAQGPPFARCDAQEGCVLNARMSGPDRPAIRAGEESWEGPIFLPPRGGTNDGRLFLGRVRGQTVVYPFSSHDRFELETSRGVLSLLADATFTPQEWVVRPDATHGKSRTYRRTNIFGHDSTT